MADFGLQIEPQFGFTYAEIKDLALECEELGFRSLWLSDHLLLNTSSQDRNCLDCWTALAALAAHTTSLRLGPLVSCVSFRYPSLLAKMAATVDLISDGRLEFGIGAGWKEIEYRAYGIPFPSPGERVSRLAEAIQVVHAMWTQDQPVFNGRYYQINDAFCRPRPVQEPRPPIWVGGSGPRVLRTAARYADGVNILGFPTPLEYRQILEGLHASCRQVGRDPSTLRLSHFAQIILADDKGSLAPLVEAEAHLMGRTPDEYWAGKRGFIGVPQECVDYLHSFIDLGVTQFMLRLPYQHESQTLRILADKVLPQLG